MRIFTHLVTQGSFCSLRGLASVFVLFLCLPSSALAEIATAGSVTLIEPACVAPGDPVMIRGLGFGAENLAVEVDGLPAEVLQATGNNARFRVPATAAPGSATVTVRNPGGQSGHIGLQIEGAEICDNELDDDCDGEVDEADACDLDEDGFTVADGDCDDTDAGVNPGAAEICEDGIDQDCSGSDVVCTGVLLEGAPESLALDAVHDYQGEVGIPEEEITLNASDIPVARTQLEIQFAADATVAEVNALLEAYGARIVSMLENTPYLVLRVPDPGTLDALEDLWARLREEPLVLVVFEGYLPKPDVLPSNVSADDTARINSQLAVGAHAAWNARAALGYAGTRQPALVIADFFGDGQPMFPDFAINVLDPSDFESMFADCPTDWIVRQNNICHGYLVLGRATAQFGGADNPDDQLTGTFPGTLAVRAVDKFASPLTGSTENELILRMKQTQGNVVINTSLGWDCGLLHNQRPCTPFYAAVRGGKWALKMQIAGLEERALHFTSAGNIKSPNLTPFVDATLNSAYAAAALLDLVLVDNLHNTVVVENRYWTEDSETGRPAPSCLSNDSRLGGQLSAIGRKLYGLFSEDGIALFAANGGTSSAAPQAAGVGAYLWALDPDLTPPEAIDIMTATARTDFIPGAEGFNCNPKAGAPVLDAYAAILGADRPAALEPPGIPAEAPARLAILDINATLSTFTETDLDAFLEKFRDPGFQPDFSRYDLNGDGETSGVRTDRFDLDIDRPPVYEANIVHPLEGIPVPFSEQGVTDIEILCYYAYSPLFTGDPAARAERLADSETPVCIGISLELEFPAQLDPGQAATLLVRASRQPPFIGESAPVAGEGVPLEIVAVGGSVEAADGVTNADGVFETVARMDTDSISLVIEVKVPGAAGQVLANEVVVALTEEPPPPAEDVSGTYVGTGLNFDYGDCFPFRNGVCEETPTDIVITQEGNQLTITFFNNGWIGEGIYNAVLTGSTFSGSTDDCKFGSPPCDISGSFEGNTVSGTAFVQNGCPGGCYTDFTATRQP